MMGKERAVATLTLVTTIHVREAAWWKEMVSNSVWHGLFLGALLELSKMEEELWDWWSDAVFKRMPWSTCQSFTNGCRYSLYTLWFRIERKFIALPGSRGKVIHQCSTATPDVDTTGVNRLDWRKRPDFSQIFRSVKRITTTAGGRRKSVEMITRWKRRQPCDLWIQLLICRVSSKP